MTTDDPDDDWVMLTDDFRGARIMAALRRVRFGPARLQPRLFTHPGSIGRFGTPPFRIEVMNAIDGLPIPVIGLTDLTTNKTAAGRHKDLADLENLPQGSQGPEPAWRTSSTLERAHAHDLGLGP